MKNRRTQLQEDTYFRVMKLLQANPDMTQREIAEKLGLSISGLNYCLKALLEHGLDQSTFLKLQMLVSFWHEQFPFENCCSWTLSAAIIKVRN